MENVIGSILVFIGTYTTSGSKGVYVYRLDPANGNLVSTGHVAEVQNPSFVAPSPDGRFLYAVSSRGGKTYPNGAICAFRIDHKTGVLTPLNAQSSVGKGPCHVSVTADGRLAAIANYGSGSVVLFKIAEDGSLDGPGAMVQHEGSSLTRRQKGPHAHSITLDPTTGDLAAADLGTDEVRMYDVADDKLKLATDGILKLAPGAGPRHVEFHPGGRWLYVINELDSTITFFSRPKPEASFASVQTVSTLPADFAGNNTTADIHLHPNGRVLYGSNRGHDSIASFAVDPKRGTLKAIGHTPSGGKDPRNFGIAPGGRYLYAAHQSTDNIVAFKIDPETGALQPTGFELKIPMPVCVRFVQTR
ncbi:MAG: lactonase family protein [Lentisphaeria bacterium]|nr:lactonase family protein [Lentisphaeria bacterium]